MFTSKQKTTSTQSTQIPKDFQQFMSNTLKFANEQTNKPFTPYSQDRIASLSANEQQGTGLATSTTGMYQPLMDLTRQSSMDMLNKKGVPNQGDLDQFMNPYINTVLTNALGRLNEQSDKNMTNIGSMAGMAGAFGGSRHGVLEGANLSELLKSSGELTRKHL